MNKYFEYHDGSYDTFEKNATARGLYGGEYNSRPVAVYYDEFPSAGLLVEDTMVIHPLYTDCYYVYSGVAYSYDGGIARLYVPIHSSKDVGPVVRDFITGNRPPIEEALDKFPEYFV